MTLRIVNTSPGEDSGTVKPDQFMQFGMKSESLSVDLASLSIEMGFSNILNHGVLPENDDVVKGLGVDITLETSERRRPIDGETSITLSGSSTIFTKNNTSDGELGIYEVKAPITERASCLAVFKFKVKTAWTAFNPDWCTLTDMTGMYFGLEHGTFNTAAYMFLRSTVNGSLVVGGPLPAYNTVRPGQIEIVPGTPHVATPGFPWRIFSDGSLVEFYIFYNVEGYETSPATGIPALTPLVEIWTKSPIDAGPVIQAYIPISQLGTFPSSLGLSPFTNSRPGPSNTATMFFGNISRTSGSDVLELVDWAFYPDFRIAVNEGIPRPNHSSTILPDAPVEFEAASNILPTDLTPGRWFPETGSSWITPSSNLFYQAGRRGEALYVQMQKEDIGLAALRKTEPRIEERLDGVMVEAFISGVPTAPDGDGTGMGFSIEDGLKAYKVLLVQTPQRSYYGIVKDDDHLDDATIGYHSPTLDADISSPKMVRLVVDRLRPSSLGGGKAQLHVDEEVVLTTDLSSDVFPAASSSTGKVLFGHLGLKNARSDLHLSRLNYLSRYRAWEAVDGLTPDDAVNLDPNVVFSLDTNGAGSSSIVDGQLVLTKTDVGGSSHRLYTKNQDFAEIGGQQIDFKLAIDAVTDSGGQAFPNNTATGITLTAYLGNKKVQIGFYDCGIFGRQVAILPSSALESDIINQTEIGRQYSAPVDWTQDTQYRLVVKGLDRLELTIGSPLNPPAISIPWVDAVLGFDIPTDVSTPRLVFGHSGVSTTSTARWSFVRWGMSNGYEVAVQQKFPDGYPKYLFGGNVLIKSDFDEA